MDDLLQLLRDDYARHGRSLRHLGFWALVHYRLGHAAQALPAPLERVGAAAYTAAGFFLDAISGVEIDRNTRIGERLHLVHGWNIKIHPDAVIGDGVGIMHDVTLGTNMARPGAPVVEDGVFIGAGARVLGPVRIGRNARIGGNSLVITDVPAGTTAVGVPARIIRYTGRAASKPAPAVPSTPP